MNNSLKLAKSVFNRVKRKLNLLRALENVDMEDILNKNGFSGQFWSLKFDIEASGKDYPTLGKSKLSDLENSLNFRLPPSYSAYLSEIANGGIGGWSSIIYALSPEEIPKDDDLIVENFPLLEIYYAPTAIDEFNAWDEKYLTGKGLILSQIDNGDDIFIICEGNLPDSVWWWHSSTFRYVPLAKDFLSFFLKNLLHTEKMVDVIFMKLAEYK